MGLRNDKLVEVCDQCHRACCYYGEFMCDESFGAGTELMTVGELRKLRLEHPEYWSKKKFKDVYGTSTPSFSLEKRCFGCEFFDGCNGCSHDLGRHPTTKGCWCPFYKARELAPHSGEEPQPIRGYYERKSPNEF